MPCGNMRKLPALYWADAIQAFTYIRNRSPVTGKDKTPFEIVTGRKPDVSQFKTFGCIVAVPVHRRTKNDNPREKMRFVGYSHDSSTYLVESLEHRGRRYANRADCKFFEDRFSVKEGREYDDDDDWVDDVVIGTQPVGGSASAGGGSSVHGSQLQGGKLALTSESVPIPVPPQNSTTVPALSTKKQKKTFPERLGDSINQSRQDESVVSTSNRFITLGESEDEAASKPQVNDEDDGKYPTSTRHKPPRPSHLVKCESRRSLDSKSVPMVTTTEFVGTIVLPVGRELTNSKASLNSSMSFRLSQLWSMTRLIRD